MTHYLTEEDFRKVGFPFIQQVLAEHEPAPNYLSEPNGMAELLKVISFVQNDLYYPTFSDKAAYLLCSVAGSQYFSNGNKRLAVTTLMLFLAKNSAAIPKSIESKYEEILRISFPLHAWEGNEQIKEGHPLFLYNLAIVIGDRAKWGMKDFSAVRDIIAMVFDGVYRLEM
jgi:prophage maintenance system killer protein